MLNAHFSNEINSIAALTNYYRFRKEYLVNLMPHFERSIEGFFSMRMCILCELLISLISLFNSIIFRTLVMSFIHHYKINLLTFLLYARCSGLLSKWEWLAFVGKNGLKLNDFINSLWLDLIDTENITAHIKWFYPLSWLTLFDSIKLTSS